MQKLTVMTTLVAVMVAIFATAAVADIITGTNGDDELVGTPETDQINGLFGKDYITGKDGADELFGGRGADQLRGGYGADDVYGGRGGDVLSGGRGNDTIFARDGYVDFISCEAGVDRVFADEDDRFSRSPAVGECEFVNGEEPRG